MLNFLKKPITLSFYTNSVWAYERAQWQKAVLHKPQWWKDLPVATEERVLELGGEAANMKGCVGFNDLYNRSFVLPLWSDLILEIGGVQNPDYWSYQFADNRSVVEVHPVSNRGDFLPHNQWQHFKLVSPWIATCEEDLSMMYTSASYHQKDPTRFFSPHATVNYKDQLNTDLHIFLKRSQTSRRELFKAGEIMSMVTPLTDRKVVIKHHLVSDDEFIKIHSSRMQRLSFAFSYRKQQKCPFKRNK
jgi:hypothetical protein